MSRLNPIAQLDAHLNRSFGSHRFVAKSARSAQAWQRRTRSALRRCLAIDEIRPSPLCPELIEETDRGTHLQRKFIIRSTRHSDVPVYVLIPKGDGEPRPCVLALHGHGYGVKAILGISEDGAYREEPAGYQRDFAVELVRRGFVVAAPEIYCFGEREASYAHLSEHSPQPSTCHNASTYAMMLGLTVAGIRVWDGMRVVDLLETLPEADTSRLGVMGISGGGMHAFFSACLDARIKAAVISGYFCDWRQSILAISHCTCNFVPGLMKLGELSDIAGLIAPRPLLIENGTQDSIFPIAEVKATVAKARRAWKTLGAAAMIEEDYFEDGHRINGEKAYPFLLRHLH